MDLGRVVDTAYRSHLAGDHAGATALYKTVLVYQPDVALVFQLLGDAALRLGGPEASLRQLARAMVISPRAGAPRRMAGEAHRVAGARHEAAACFQAAIDRDPGDIPSWAGLGLAFSDLGLLAPALAAFKRCLVDFPASTGLLSNAAVAVNRDNNMDVADRLFKRATTTDPAAERAWFGRANNDFRAGRPLAAIPAARRAILLQPGWAEPLVNIAGWSVESGAVETVSKHHYHQLKVLQPDNPSIYLNETRYLNQFGRSSESLRSGRRALILAPERGLVYSNMGNAALTQGRHALTNSMFRRGLMVHPRHETITGAYLMSLHYLPGIEPEHLYEEHRARGRRLDGLDSFIHGHVDTRDKRRLSIGFVSADPRQHPVGFFLSTILTHMDRERFETTCYAGDLVADGITETLRSKSGRWRDVAGLSDDALTETIRADGIDILFDLSGYTAGGRLGVFARRAAPIQASWMGYVCTTGLKAMDYFLTDRHQTPPDTGHLYTERLVELDDGWLCYQPPAGAPDVGPSPILSNGYPTFGSLGNPAKVTTPVLEDWGEILRRVPESRLVLWFHSYRDPTLRARILKVLGGYDVAPHRITFGHSMNHLEALATYNQIDIALDTRPYSGGLTTCEGLWMGVPVITLPGRTFASRHTLSHLSNLGLEDLVADSRADYVDKAITLAADPTALSVLRANLRDRFINSPLYNGPRFVAGLERKLLGIWDEYREHGPRQGEAS